MGVMLKWIRSCVMISCWPMPQGSVLWLLLCMYHGVKCHTTCVRDYGDCMHNDGNRGVMTVIMVDDSDCVCDDEWSWLMTWWWSWCDDEWSWFDNGDCDVMTVTLPSVYVTRCRHFTNSSRTFMTSTRSTAGRDRISRRTSWFVSLENVVMSVEHRYCQYVLNCMLFFLFKYVDLCSARKLYNYCVHLVCNMHHWTSVTG